MADDAKSWKNIRIEEPVRDDARDDPRTYTEIMRDGLADESALRVSEEHRGKEIADAVVERLEGSKPLEDMAFDDWFEPDHAETIARHVAAELVAGDLADRLDRIESAAEAAEERTGSIQNALETEGIGR